MLPASAPALSFILKGIQTIRWGTDGFMQDAALQNGAAIVDSCKQARRVDKFYIENNAGFQIGTILLIQGQNYDIMVTDDTTKSWPLTGAKILMLGPDDQVAIEFLIVDDDYPAEKKKEGKRHFLAECYQAFAVV